MTKESLYGVAGSKLLFRETFNSEQAVRSNGGSITSIVFSKGQAAMSDGSSKLTYKKDFLSILNNACSVRLIVKVTGGDNTAYRRFFYMDDGLGNNFQISNNDTDYTGVNTSVNGNFVASTNGVNDLTSFMEIVVTYDGGTDVKLYVNGVNYTEAGSGLGYATENIINVGGYGDVVVDVNSVFELLEIYEGTLNASQVKNLYEDKTYHALPPTNTILDFNPTTGSLNNQLAGSAIGADIVTNGTFDTDSDWVKFSEWTISGGVASCDGTQSTPVDIRQPNVTQMKDDTNYLVSFEILNYVAGSVNITVGYPYSAGTSYSSNGVFTETIKTAPSLTYQRIYVIGNSDFNGSVDNVVVKEIAPDVVNTSTTLVKDTSYVGHFDGADSKLDMGDYNDLTGDITIAGWIKLYGWGEYSDSYGWIIDNAKLHLISRITNSGLEITSDGTTDVYSGADLSLNKWFHIAVTRTSVGIINFYVNGVLSGSADQDSGTPEVGTTNIIIGNSDGQDRTFNGNIGELKIYSGLLSLQEINQHMTSTKSKFT